MDQPDCPMCALEAAALQARVEQLETLFQRLIRKEYFRISSSSKGYEKTYSGLAFVTAIAPWTLDLETEDGSQIAPLRINPAIANLIQVNDGIVLEVKFHNEAWRLTRYEWMNHYEFVENDNDLSDGGQEWEEQRQANQQKNNDDSGLH